MEAFDIRRPKRKRMVRSLWSNYHFFSARSLFLCFSFFLFLFFIISSDRFSSRFRPNLSPSSLSLLYSSASYSVLHSLNFNQTFLRLPFTLQHHILFPDHILLIVTGDKIPPSNELECVYYKFGNLSEEVINDPVLDVLSLPVISTDHYAEFRSIVGCPIHPTNYSSVPVHLRRRGGKVGDRHRSWELLTNLTNQYSWNNLAYEAYLDGDTVVVFVKGLNLRPHQISDPTQFRCHFGLKNGEFILKTKVISAAQEVVHCSLPRSIANNPNKAQDLRVTVSHSGQNKRRPINKLMPSVSTIQNRVMKKTTTTTNKEKHELCVCTMVWNQASALKEWIMYHSWLGVERWFIYDNNSDDDIGNVIGELNLEGYNVSRTTWPWIKTQEAGFSHCALRSKQECNWVGFFDVDEFFYLKNRGHHQNALKSLVSNFSSSSKLAEIRTACHNFGPSGLTSHPKRGVTTEYTCRMKNSERHKSIVKPEMLDTSLLNVVHHFELKEGMWSVQLKEGEGVINHYKYQVWERFKDKFLRRVATYVVDWYEDKNKRSKDTAPGLGTEAIEPPNWRSRFCEVWDNGLKDFVLSHFAHPETGTLPWEESLSSRVQ